jgi:phage-related protein (TIGR01555 family)
MSAKVSLLRKDGWQNLFTKIGTQLDRVKSTQYARDRFKNKVLLESIYLSDGLGRRIVDIVPNDGTREWITIPEDTDGLLLEELDRLQARVLFRRAWKWARLYGGAVILLGADDGGDFEEPLNETNIRSVEFLRVYDRWQTSWTYPDLETNPQSPEYGKPQFFWIAPYNMPGAFRVHKSRLLRFEGDELPDKTRIENHTWGASEFESVYETLKTFGFAFQASANIISDFIQTTLTVKNLQNMIAAGNESQIITRLSLIDQSRSMINTILLDENESYTKVASSVAGLPDLLDRFSFLICAVTGIPMSRLFGRSPSGLTASSETESDQYFDMVAAQQNDILLEPLNRLKQLLLLAADSKISNADPTKYTIEFNPLWQMSDKEQADMRYVMAQADNLYAGMGAVDPQDIAKSRFGGDKYSIETQYDQALQNKMAAERKAAFEATINPEAGDATDPSAEPPDRSA